MEGKSAARWFQGTYRAEPAQVGWARRALARALGDHPFADDATLIASEFATNAILHSARRVAWATLGTAREPEGLLHQDP